MPKSRVLPHNLEAEQSILGCILMDEELQSELMGELDADDFYVEAHRDIFAAMLDIYNGSRPIDLVTLSDKLDGMAKLDMVGGIAYLTDLVSVIPSTANYASYLEIIKRDSVLRKLIRGANRIIEDSYESTDGDASLRKGHLRHLRRARHLHALSHNRQFRRSAQEVRTHEQGCQRLHGA